MPTIATFGNRIDMLKGVFQLAPTDFSQGDIADFYAHCYQERQKELRSTGHFRITKKEFPASAIEHTTIRTEYIPVYRIHSKQYFQAGPNYGANWLLSERKRNNNERYSPFGTEGFYFGLTLPAAEHEARHYGEGQIDPKKYMILVMECCFDNILYLSAGAIGVVWEVVGLDPPESLMDMYLKIMDPNTNNKVTNAIGLWARREGFDGLIYP